MDKEQDTQSMGTVSDFLSRKPGEDGENLEATREYLMSMFLSSAVDALFDARRKEPLEYLREFVIDNPEVLPTQELYQDWVKKKSELLFRRQQRC